MGSHENRAHPVRPERPTPIKRRLRVVRITRHYTFTKIELSSLAVVAVMWILCAFESQPFANRRRLPDQTEYELLKKANVKCTRNEDDLFPLIDDNGLAVTDEEGKMIECLVITPEWHVGYYIADADVPEWDLQGNPIS